MAFWDDAVKISNPTMNSQTSTGTKIGPEQYQEEIMNAGGPTSVIQAPDIQWGGEGGAANWSTMGLGGMNNAQMGQTWSGKEGNRARGATAFENQALSDNEAYSRGYDQSGSIQLAREAAMGEGPSAAAYQMQRGLDQSLAAQQAQMGSARGNAAIAMAGGNAAANSANLMNQTYQQAGQMRADEMAQARGLYGGLSGQMREQDQARLQQGSQMSQFNAGLNDQYKLGMGALSNQFGNQANQWYNSAQNPITQQGNLELGGYQVAQGAATAANELKAAAQQAKRDADQAEKDKWLGLAGTAVTAGGGAAGAAMTKGVTATAPKPAAPKAPIQTYGLGGTGKVPNGGNF